MAISSKLRLPRGLNAALFPLVLWACSSGGSGEDPKEPIDSPKAGSSTMTPDSAGAPGNGGSGGEPDDMNTGNTGAVGGEPMEEPSNGGTGGTGGNDTGGTGGTGGSDPDPTPSAGAGGEEPGPTGPSEAFLRGEALAELNQCVTCHQANYAGFTVFPNITPDVATGIGSWTDEQIVAALRDGKDADGSNLCATMQRYSFTNDQAADMVAFLRGLPAVSNSAISECPGHGQ
jgi:mono/diheme cytochrome c family protein